MKIWQKCLCAKMCFTNVFFYTWGLVNATSLWGKKIDFMQKDCSFWLLKNERKIPSLNELSVCVNIKRKLSNSYWTAFTYLHPNKTRIELGLKGFGTELHVIMFGRVWTKSSVVSLDNWHSICMTWSNSMTEPKVYINGTKVELKPQSKGTALHPNCCSVAAGGTLTLAVAHNFVKNKISIETGTELKGSLSLFRVWKRARSAQDISTMACTDGDMLHWEKRIWNKAEDCMPIQDLTQKCGKWHKYTHKKLLTMPLYMAIFFYKYNTKKSFKNALNIFNIIFFNIRFSVFTNISA